MTQACASSQERSTRRELLLTASLYVAVLTSAVLVLLFPSRLHDILGASLFLPAAVAVICLQLRAWLRRDPSQGDISHIERWVLAIVFGGIAALYVYRLDSMPWMFCGDGVRDGPAHARSLLDDQHTRFFSLGSYASHTYILAALNLPFEWLFPRSTTSLRLAGAFFSVVMFVVFYFVVRRDNSSLLAAAATALFALSPMVTWQGRNEMLVVLNMLYVVIGLAWLRDANRTYKALEMSRCGFVAGFAMYLHLAASFAALTIAGLFAVVQSVRNYRAKSFSFVPFLAYLMGFVLAVLPIGSTTTNLIRAASTRIRGPAETAVAVSTWWEHYKNSAASLWRPSYINFHAPPVLISLVTIEMLLFAALGILCACFARRFSSLRSVLLAVVAVFVWFGSHSAITEAPVAAHRLVVVIPVVAYFLGIGLAGSQIALRAALSRAPVVGAVLAASLVSAVVCLAGWRAYTFWAQVAVAEQRRLQSCDYQAATIGRTLSAMQLKSDVCLVPPDEATSKCLQHMHIRDMLEYLSGKRFTVLPVPQAPASSVIEVLPSPCSEATQIK